jgi:hypothetical protein
MGGVYIAEAIISGKQRLQHAELGHGSDAVAERLARSRCDTPAAPPI